MKKKYVIWIVVILTIIGIFIAELVMLSQKEKENYISYSEVVEYIKNREITEVTMYTSTIVAEAKTKEGVLYKTKIPARDTFLEFITEEVKKGNPVRFNLEEPKKTPQIIKTISSVIETIFLTICQLGINILVILFLVAIIDKKTDGKLTEMFGDKNFAEQVKSDVKFSDVAGIDEEKEQIEEIVEFLKNPKKYDSIGAQIPKGILLLGSPGTGKTLLAKAIAGEAGVPFYQVNGAEFEEKFVGVGASRVRTLFKTARQNAPCIIFIDEIDAVAAKRYGEEKNYSEQTLNMLLSEMDGFKGSEGIIVMAATNHEEVLDEAILRPGRFDRKVYIPLPDEYARREILQTHSKGKKISENVDLTKISKKTTGFSGAELKNLLNEAAIIAINRNAEEIEECDLDEAYARITIGLEKRKRPISQEEKFQTAIHEAGHAVVSFLKCPGTEIMGISIIPRGRAGGYNLFNEQEKMYLTQEEATAKMIVLYGGKAAEKVILNIASSGPSNDLENAAKIAYNIETKFGMGKKLVTCIGEFNFDQMVLKESFQLVQEKCSKAYEEAERIIKDNQSLVIKLANELMENESLSSEEVRKILENN